MTLLNTTELEAVNMMLAAISEAPVSTLADDTIDDANIATQTLREMSKEIQSEGWHFNTDYDWPIAVDSDLKLPYPAGVGHADPMASENKDLVKVGLYFWDRENLTFFFAAGASYKFKIVWLRDYEDLPQLWRTYITMEAANRFVAQQLGDQYAFKYSINDVQQAKARALADDLRRADTNMMNNADVARVLGGRRRISRWQG